jgi:Flp pilus assembly pilin Flp
MKVLSFFRDDETGATAVEYAVMLALILAGIIGAVSAVGSGTGGMWGGTKANLDSVGFGN